MYVSVILYIHCWSIFIWQLVFHFGMGSNDGLVPIPIESRSLHLDYWA